MRIGGRRREEDTTEAPPKGPWSDLPPDPPPRSAPRFTALRPRRTGPREPIISNWRGLLIVLFLLLVAPWVARWASTVILGMMPGH